jgi:hypothetical protein
MAKNPKVPKIKPLYKQSKSTFALDTSVAIPALKAGEQDINLTFPEVNREEATVEAEKGERIVTPKLENFAIGGKSHGQGGTPINAEEGSFIFSKMKNLKVKGDILNEFGIDPDSKRGKKGLTPAELAAKYATNPFLKTLKDPNTDSLEKKTAAMMISNMTNKLDKLKFVQESIKGFPDGIPEMESEEPEEMQFGGPIRPRKVTKSPGAGYKVVQDDELMTVWMKPGQPGSTIKVPKGAPDFNRAFADARKKGLSTFTWKGKPYNTKVAGKTPGSPEDWAFMTKSFDFPEDTPGQVPGTITPRTNMTDLPAPQLPAPSAAPLKTWADQPIDTGYGIMDYAHMAASWNPINKYNPIRIHVNPEEMAFRPVDLEAQRQAVRGRVGQAQQANNLISPSAPIASSRNAQIMSQGLDPMNQSFGQEFNTNQATRMKVDEFNAQSRTQANMANAGFNDQYNTRQAEVNDNYDIEKRFRLQNFMKQWDNAETNRQVRNASNVINQDYMITANGQVMRKPSSFDPERQMARITGAAGTQGGNAYPTMSQFRGMFSDALSGLTEAQIADKYFDYLKQTSYTDKNSDGVADQVRTRNPYLMKYFGST